MHVFSLNLIQQIYQEKELQNLKLKKVKKKITF